MTVDQGYLKSVGWAVPWVWAACTAIWAVWLISHDRVTQNWMKRFHERVGKGIHPVRIIVFLGVFIGMGLALQRLMKPTQHPLVAENKQVQNISDGTRPAKPGDAVRKPPTEANKRPNKSKAPIQVTVQGDHSVGGVINQDGSNNIAQIGNNNQASIDTGRRLGKGDRDALVGKLTGLRAKVGFGSILAVPDAYLYASDLREAFKSAGIEDAFGSSIQPLTFGEKPWTGVAVSWRGDAKEGEVDVPNDSVPGKILVALTAAHVSPLLVHIGMDIPEDLVKITVGLKPEAKKD